MTMGLPSGATVSIILPFSGAIVLILLFSTCYVRRYRDVHDSETSTIIASILSMAIALLTSALLPIDIFIVSFMKNVDGTFKEWASDLTFRTNVENSVLYSYYTLYSLIFFCIFILIPFMYFYYEEREDDGFYSNNDRICNSVKYTMVFVFAASILLVFGAFIPLREAPPTNSTSNSTEWDKFKFIIDDLSKNRGEDALSMVLSILTSIGVINLVVFTGFGISSWPIGLIRGTKSARVQAEEIHDTHLVNQTKINALKDKERFGTRLNARERRQLHKLEETERLITRQEMHLNDYRDSLFYKFRNVIRPIQISFGFAAGAFSLIIWISLLLTNIDKAMHSLGMKMGYALPKRSIPNPIDIILVFLQRAFPLDYIFILGMAYFFVMSTISGIRNLGLWFFCIKMFKLRPKRTKPQGLLLLCATLMLTVLGINILFYCVSPQYTTFGSQHYVMNATHEDNKTSTAVCSADQGPEFCTMTRASALLVRFFYKAWYFGVFYYWSSWAFLAMSALTCLYVIIRRSRSATDGLVDEEDLEESDDELIRP